MLILTSSTVSLQSNEEKILGRKLKTIFENKPYVAFYKIPYAEPPINALRFKPPKDIFQLRKPINEFNSTLNNEDCLYLSIYTPLTKNKTEKFPVLVWTHEYSNCHGPDFFIEEEVIVVTVSFRSAIFGFLNTEDDYAKGNMGAKDILMAVKWVRDNISLFNGDSNRVTIVSSGIASTVVASMLLSPNAEDLFTRAIILDGSALSPADYRPNHNNEVVKKIYWKLKGRINKFDKKELYEILGSASFNELLLASRNLYDSSEVRDNQRIINSFSCSVETTMKGAFMNQHPLDAYESKLVNTNIDVIFGYTTLPNLYRLQGISRNRILMKYLNYNFQYLLPFEGICDEYGSKRYKRIRKQIMDFYFVNGTITKRSLRRYAKYLSDQVIYPLLRQALLHVKTRSNVYLSRFAYQGSLNIGWKSSVPNLKWAGATLGDEICYLFKCKSKTEDYKRHEASNERQFIKKIVRLFANFAKYGNPTPCPSDNILGNLQWNPLKRDKKLQAMNLGRSLRMIEVPEVERMNFWDQLREELFQN
ncbi:juvenile hormone esterase-like [Maniola hyperantus]|uniref:juvenile hormone esterase-like n=1 Tax=Aphantopus hyperantus TaxID=2795564 RepID=UPI00374A1718